MKLARGLARVRFVGLPVCPGAKLSWRRAVLPVELAVTPGLQLGAPAYRAVVRCTQPLDLSTLNQTESAGASGARGSDLVSLVIGWSSPDCSTHVTRLDTLGCRSRGRGCIRGGNGITAREMACERRPAGQQASIHHRFFSAAPAPKALRARHGPGHRTLTRQSTGACRRGRCGEAPSTRRTLLATPPQHACWGNSKPRTTRPLLSGRRRPQPGRCIYMLTSSRIWRLRP